MSTFRLAFLGDTVGAPGRRAAVHAARLLKESGRAHLVVVNAENARNGSGLSPDNLRELLRGGIDGATLGDHCFKDRTIVPILEDPSEPVSRPANLAVTAPGKRRLRLNAAALGEGRPLYIVTVLGRLFMSIPSDSPFAAVDRELELIPERDAVVVVEIHAEATSEKQAMAWHCLEKWTAEGKPRVAAVLGTHTHVQTSDARLIDYAIAAITDLGMCGPHRSVIGRDARATLAAMSLQTPSALEVAESDVRAMGVVIEIDAASRRPVGIERLEIGCPD